MPCLSFSKTQRGHHIRTQIPVEIYPAEDFNFISFDPYPHILSNILIDLTMNIIPTAEYSAQQCEMAVQFGIVRYYWSCLEYCDIKEILLLIRYDSRSMHSFIFWSVRSLTCSYLSCYYCNLLLSRRTYSTTVASSLVGCKLVLECCY